MADVFTRGKSTGVAEAEVRELHANACPRPERGYEGLRWRTIFSRKGSSDEPGGA